MNTTFENTRISGILGVLPEKAYSFDEEMQDGYGERAQKIKKNMGYGQRYRVKKDTTVSMLFVEGLRHLFNNGILCPDDIGALVVSTFTPDYFLPQVCNIVQAECGLPEDVFCMDLWGGCTAYIEGVWQCMSLREHMDSGKKVLLLVGDVACRSNGEKQVYDSPPYGGDAASITIFERSDGDQVSITISRDGTRGDLVSLKQGAFWDIFHQKETMQLSNTRESFMFFQEKIPDLIEDVLAKSNLKVEDIDYYSIIQANKLCIKKFADKLSIPYDRLSMNFISEYGDVSASVNPIGIVDYYGEKLMEPQKKKVFICGYGAGLSWGATIIDIGSLVVSEIIKTDL